jgi:hypothetical protein
MHTLGKFFTACLIGLASAACSAHHEHPPAVPCHFTQQSYERICNHPSMTEAARREAYACHAYEAKLAALPLQTALHVAQR